MSTLSVLIATKNRPDELKACLRSVVAQDRHADEVVVVDQSDSPHRSVVEEHLESTRIRWEYSHAPELTGLTQARNRAIAAASGRLLLFLDDDVELAPGYVRELLAVFERDRGRRIGGASGFTENFLQRLSSAQRVRSWLFYRGPFSVEGDPIAFHLRPGDHPRFARRLHGSNMAFRRAVFDELRFDESYTGYGFGEDRDFSVRIARRFDLVWIPQARLIHHEAHRSRLSRERFCELRILSWLRFFRNCVPRSPSTLLWYVWLNIGFATLLAQVWDPATVRGTYRGLRRLLRILAGREELERALADHWHAEARVRT